MQPGPLAGLRRHGAGIARLRARGQNDRVNAVRHILVLPDRDAAEEMAQAVAERLGLQEEPRPLREALAGEDDAEDAQWLVVLEDPPVACDPATLDALDALAAEYEGWLERS